MRIEELTRHLRPIEVRVAAPAHGDHDGGVLSEVLGGSVSAEKKKPKPRPRMLAASQMGAPDSAGHATIVGKTFPRATVTAQLAAGGPAVAATRADKKGHFQVTIQVDFGTRTCS